LAVDLGDLKNLLIPALAGAMQEIG
jgi:hypothetical protein